jgi:predicted RNA-binding protein with PUA-like domain
LNKYFQESVVHNHWIFKTDPSVYSFQNLLDDRKVTWKQVKNTLALKELRNVKTGDVIVIYHDGDERKVVGTAEALSDPYQDPDSEDPRFQVIDIRAIKKLTKAVHFWEIKSHPLLKNIDLVRIPELNVDSIDDIMWEEIMILAKERVK